MGGRWQRELVLQRKIYNHMTKQRRSQEVNCKCHLVGEFLFPAGEGLSEYMVHVFETSVDHVSSESSVL